MSNVLEQFHAAEVAVKSAQEALEVLHVLLGQPKQNNGGVTITLTSRQRAARWNLDPAKKARAIARFKRTMKAKRLARAAALATTGVEG